MSRRISIARDFRPAQRGPRTFLYVEGPRDREIVEGWALRTSRPLAACVRESTVILGGKQPARAREHLANARSEHGEARGLCVLDRDQEHGLPAAAADGLELYVWSRRHIESYLLVPDALRRVLRHAGERALRELENGLPAEDDERGWRDLDAKRRLTANGQRFPWGRLARAMRDEELHADVHGFLERLATLFGVAIAPQVARRPSDPLAP